MPEPCQHPEAVVVAVASHLVAGRPHQCYVHLLCRRCGVGYAETRDDPDRSILVRAMYALSRLEILRPVRQIDG